jgi:lysyl-tRNA synthetase class 2
MEQHIHALPVTLHSLTGNEKTLYLHTSPEFCCKKILATGEDRIFTLSRVWRDEIESKMHSPEFTMLEWYRHKCCTFLFMQKMFPLHIDIFFSFSILC